MLRRLSIKTIANRSYIKLIYKVEIVERVSYAWCLSTISHKTNSSWRGAAAQSEVKPGIFLIIKYKSNPNCSEHGMIFDIVHERNLLLPLHLSGSLERQGQEASPATTAASLQRVQDSAACLPFNYNTRFN